MSKINKMQIFFDEATELINSEQRMLDIFLISQKYWKKNVAIISEKNKLTFAQIKKEIYGFSNGFSQNLPNDSSFVGIKLTNSPKWIYAFWGVLFSGHCPILINNILDKENTERILGEIHASAIITDDNQQYSIKTMNIDSIDSSNQNEIDFNKCANKVAFSTSGTTGLSRIFIYSGKELCNQIYAAWVMPETSKTIMYNDTLRVITILPFAHIFGFVAVYLWYSFFGRTLVFTKSNAPEDIVECCKNNKVSHIYAVPLFWDRVSKSIQESVGKMVEKRQKLVENVIKFNNKELSKVEAGLASKKFVIKKVQKEILGDHVVHCISGGSYLSKDTLHMINGVGYPLYNGYGMTEIGITSVELSPDVNQRNKASIGKPLTNIEYKIENGELLVKSPQIHGEIVVDSQIKSAQFDENGYFHTGDLASVDENGNYYIKGKIKELILGSNGENIFPEEIETKFKNISNINQVAALGIKSGNNEKLALIFTTSSVLNKDEIKKMENEFKDVNDSLPIAKKVQEFFLSLEPLPLNTSMKIMRYKLLDEFTNRPEMFVKLSNGSSITFEGFDENKVNEVVEHLKDIVGDILNINKDTIGTNDNIILDLGGDSFTYMSVIASIEGEFEIKIKSEFIGKLNTINEFALYILKNN